MTPPQEQPTPIRAAIVGLGQIGCRFDEDPKRAREIWTHAAAYAATPGVVLVAGVDSDSDRRLRFESTRPSVTSFATLDTLFAQAAPIDLLSICTPTVLHAPMVHEAIRAGVRAIFCEKPLATTGAVGQTLVEACRRAGVVLAVNHTRRWDPVYQTLKHRLEAGMIGEVESMVGHYPATAYTMGTHLFDLMHWYGGSVDWVVGHEAVPGQPDPCVGGFVRFASGATGHVIVGHRRSQHRFELDITGSLGRITVTDDGLALEAARYVDSGRYSGYTELGPSVPVPVAPPPVPRFVAAIQDLVQCVSTAGQTPQCSGHDGLVAVQIAEALVQSAADGSIRVPLSPC